MKRGFTTYFLFTLLFLKGSFAMSCKNEWPKTIEQIRSQVDSVSLPLPIKTDFQPDFIAEVKCQEQWDTIYQQLNSSLKKGKKNILIEVSAPILTFGKNEILLDGLDYPDAKIKIVGKNTKLVPYGGHFKNYKKQNNRNHYSYPYWDFNPNDVYLDENNFALSLYGSSFFIEDSIESVKELGIDSVLNKDGSLYKEIVKVWRFRTSLPDLDEKDCNNFYVLLTRHWTSCRHKVIMVKGGYLYFLLKSDDAPSLLQMAMDPNSDSEAYGVWPRCRYMNLPNSNGLYVKGDSIYIPKMINTLNVGKGVHLLSIKNCRLNYLELSGLNVLGDGNKTCVYVSNSSFSDQMWVNDNTFTNLSGYAIYVDKSDNICLYNNKIRNTRKTAIECSGSNITIWNNKLKDIGFMLNTMALKFGGTNIHVLENNIEDFNYSAIACGGTASNKSSQALTYIVEHNLIRHSTEFTDHYKERTVADGGGIYVGPQNTLGIIRNNIVQNIHGISANRGLFLDDGAKNLIVYGNLIVNTFNCFDIDLRKSTVYSKGIPDYNTNNIIINNIITRNYRFEEANSSANCYVGQNIILENSYGNIVNVSNRKDDIVIKEYRIQKSIPVLPKKTKVLFESCKIDSFVLNHMIFR